MTMSIKSRVSPPDSAKPWGSGVSGEIGSAEAKGQQEARGQRLLGQLFESIFCTLLFLVTSVGHFLGLTGSTYN